MTITSFHHINYLVHDLSTSCVYFEALFQQKPVFESIAKRGVNTARFDLNGIYFILVQPTSSEGVVAEALAEKGEGVFLLSLTVDDMQTTSDELKNSSVELNEQTLRTGLDGWTVCDLVNESDTRTTLQLCQEKPNR